MRFTLIVIVIAINVLAISGCNFIFEKEKIPIIEYYYNFSNGKKYKSNLSISAETNFLNDSLILIKNNHVLYRRIINTDQVIGLAFYQDINLNEEDILDLKINGKSINLDSMHRFDFIRILKSNNGDSLFVIYSNQITYYK
jgi:hypothetical protein